MALSIKTPKADFVPDFTCGTAFKVLGDKSGIESPKWVLETGLEFVPPSTELTFPEIMVRFKTGVKGILKITLMDTNHCSPSPSADRYVTGVCGTVPANSTDKGGCCCNACEKCCEANPVPPWQNLCKPILFEGKNSILVDHYFQTSLRSACMDVVTMGGSLSLCFHRPNGQAAVPAGAGMPVGNGGGYGGVLALNRQLYTTTSPNSVQIVGFDGGITAYSYYAYDVLGNKLFQPGPDVPNELIQFASSGQYRELTQERTYFDYDSQGRYYRKTELNGGEVYFTYDTNNHVSKVAGDFPGALYFTYDANSNVSRVSQSGAGAPESRAWDFEYQSVATGRALSKIIGPEGCTTYFGYDGEGQVLLELDSLNYPSYYEYTYFSGTGWRVSKSIPPGATPTTFFHDEVNRAMHKQVQEPALATYYVHNDQFPRIDSAQLDPTLPTQYWGFDSGANNNRTVDRLQRGTYFAYDSFHNQTQMLDALNGSTYFGYDANNRPTRKVGIRWKETGNFIDFTTYYVYDTQGNPLQMIDAQGNTTLSAFDRGGVMVKTRNPRGNATYYGYDAYGRQVNMQDAVGDSAYFGYDLFGNRTRSVDPRWVESNFALFTNYFEYDELNRQTRTVDAEGDITEATYSSRCNEGPLSQLQLVEGIWRATYYTYDGLRRQVRMIDPLNQSTTMAYVGETSLVSQQTDKRGYPMYFGYDGEERSVRTRDALLGSTYFGYDIVGNRTRSVSIRWPESGFNDFTSYFGFDALNRQVQTLDPLFNSTYFGYDAAGNQTRMVGPRWPESNFQSFTTYYEFDTLNRLSRTIDTLGQSSRSGYDADSNRVRFQDNRGNTVYYEYDALDRQSALIDQVGNRSLSGYDAGSNLSASVDARGNVTYFRYDAVNRQNAVVDALDELIYFTFDQAGNRTITYDHITSASFALTYFGYDKLNRLVKKVDALQRTSYFVYDPNNNLLQSILPGSAVEVTQNFYDPLNRLSNTVDPQGDASYFGYDAAGNLVQQQNPRGFGSYFRYDNINRRVRTLDALNGSTYFGYDNGGNTTRMVGIRWPESNFQNFTTYFEYDALDRPTRTVDDLGQATRRFYDPNSNVTVVVPPSGGAVYFAYEPRNLLSIAVDGAFDTTYYTYDPVGHRSQVVSPRSFNTYFGYDSLNRLSQVLDAENGTAYFGYDIAGNTARVVDALSRVTYFNYNLVDRLTSSVDALSQAVYFAYDPSDNRNVETDQRGNSVYYFYDTDNRLASDRDALGKSAYYGYDTNSNLLRTFDRRGEAVYFAYDALDRRTMIQYGVGYGLGQWGIDPWGDPVQYFNYDAAGNLINYVDQWGLSALKYDPLSRLAQRVTPRGDATYYGYDPSSNLSRLQYPQGLAACYYGYDAAQRLNQLRAPTNTSTYFAYDASSNTSRKLFGNTTTCYYTYDKVERVTSIRHAKSDGTPIAYFDFNRDVAGKIVVMARETDLAVYYAYDKLDRLTSEIWRKPSDNSQVYAFSYSYDPTNNRLTQRREFGAGVEWDSTYFAYAADNSLTKRRVQTPPSTFVDTYYDYDANGALTTEWTPSPAAATYYEYGPHQLPTKITPATGAPWTFYYDGRLNRYGIDKGGTFVYYLWDGLNNLEERDASGSLIARYTHGNYRQYGIGSTVEVQRVANSTTYFQYLHMDHRGTVYAVTDQNQNVQLNYTQDAFGVQIAPTGGANPNVPNDLIYQTNWYTETIARENYCFSPTRTYKPSLAMFLQRDFQPYINRYRTWNNNPVKTVDPTGQIIITTCPIDEYLATHRINGAISVPLWGERWYFFAPNNFTDRYSEILVKLINSPRKHSIICGLESNVKECIENLDKQVKARLKMIEGAEEEITSKESTLHCDGCEEAMWELAVGPQIEGSVGKSYHQRYSGFAVEIFNVPNGDWIPGDRGYVVNLNVKSEYAKGQIDFRVGEDDDKMGWPTDSFYLGENILYLTGKRWYGWQGNTQDSRGEKNTVRTLEEWENMMQDKKSWWSIEQQYTSLKTDEEKKQWSKEHNNLAVIIGRNQKIPDPRKGKTTGIRYYPMAGLRKRAWL